MQFPLFTCSIKGKGQRQIIYIWIITYISFVSCFLNRGTFKTPEILKTSLEPAGNMGIPSPRPIKHFFNLLNFIIREPLVPIEFFLPRRKYNADESCNQWPALHLSDFQASIQFIMRFYLFINKIFTFHRTVIT